MDVPVGQQVPVHVYQAHSGRCASQSARVPKPPQQAMSPCRSPLGQHVQATSLDVPVFQQEFEQAYQAHVGAWALQSASEVYASQPLQAIALAVPFGQQEPEQANHAHSGEWDWQTLWT